MAVVSLSKLKFKYPNSDRGRLDIDQFRVEAGEKIFLFGPSGSGKTTFLEILAGVLPADSGSIKIAGTDWASLSLAQRDSYRADEVGYIFQSFNLIPYLSVLENISLPLHLSKKRRANVPKDQELSCIQTLAQRLGIKDLLDYPVTELSVGQQQRVAAVRALIGHPRLILADEPTSALDFDHRETFLKLLFDICREQNISLIFVSHDRTLQPLFDRSVALAEINKAATKKLDSTL